MDHCGHDEIENKGIYLICKAKYLGQFSRGNPLVCSVACPSMCLIADSAGFNSEFVVDGHSQTLPAANVAFGGLHGDMPEKKLNLL